MGQFDLLHIVSARNFLGFGLSWEDRLPKQVCVQCVNNLDYCVQFVDRCRRIESLLQRGLDVDYVASELDYRYTYLFPSPYAGQESRPAYPDFPTDSRSFFGPTPGLQEQQQEVDEGRGQVGGGGRGEEEGGSFQERSTSAVEPPSSSQFSASRGDTDYLPPMEPLVQNSVGEKVALTGQQKVPMYRNDVSVDNMVVEIEPNDLFPRKAGGVKPEYPWKVGGAAKKGGGGGGWKEKRATDGSGRSRCALEGESPSKKVGVSNLNSRLQL